MRKISSLVEDESGSALIEFSVSAVILMMVTFGIMDCSRALYVYHFVSYAAQQGSRYAIVRGAHSGNAPCTSPTAFNCNATAANVATYVQSIAPAGVAANAITVATNWPGTTMAGSTSGCSTVNNQGCLVAVQVSYSFSFVLPYLPQSVMNFKGSSQQVIQN